MNEPTPPKFGLTCRACDGDAYTCGCWDGEDDADVS